MDSGKYLGITQCENCDSRLRVSRTFEPHLGKNVRCPRCRSSFVLRLQTPTEIERVGIDSSSDSASESARKKRRSKLEIKEEMVAQIREGFRAGHERLNQIASRQSASEEEVRRWVVDMLRHPLGYEDKDIDTETKVLSKRVDIVLKDGDKIIVVIEVKNTRMTLSKNVRNQAVGYASHLGATWAVTTNGDNWRLYHVEAQDGTEPKIVEVFDIALLDDDGVSENDAESLFLLTSRSLNTGESEKNYHIAASTSSKRVINALMSDRVIKALRIQLEQTYEESNVHLNEDIVRDLVEDTFSLNDL